MAALTETAVRKDLANFVRLWNDGNLEEACESYAEDATFIDNSGYTRGKDKVLAEYRRRYPDRHAMGHLALELLEFRRAGRSPAMATSILRWTVKTATGTHTGFAMETYVLKRGKIYIAQDATITNTSG